ncbi:MAG: ferritin-like domain-containing protein [Elainellaceae cyanobacterium]
MSQHHSIAGLEMLHAPPTDPIHRILVSALSKPFSVQDGRVSVVSASTTMKPSCAIAIEARLPYWDATYFGLDRVQLFQDSTPAEQQAILHRASQALIQETYCIEKAGMGYMSRMALLAETLEERMLYTLFAAEETTHFVQICPFLDHEPDAIANPFLQLLSTVVECNDQALLVFVIQVVLEGWGLTHYRFLANDCLNHELRQRFHGFLRDESRHHGTGVTLFNQRHLTDSSRADIVDVLVQFLQMVQVGPQAVVEAIAQVKGHLSRTQRIQILSELDTETHSGGRLRLLRSLMQKGEGRAIAQRLDQLNVFQPLSAHQCA